MSVSTCGLYTSENAGMSSENCVRIIMAENLRFPGVGSSAPGKPGAKARPKGVVDAHTVEIPWPLNNLSILTRRWNLTRQLVSGPEKGSEISSEASESGGEKRYMYVIGARTANRHR